MHVQLYNDKAYKPAISWWGMITIVLRLWQEVAHTSKEDLSLSDRFQACYETKKRGFARARRP